ncbi:response regulator receiver protein : Response regulator receiver protein OS=Frankia sp. (strain CcI3) GN=Francci3_3461 PE=4 SV=1: Response_reg [Gemmataceae bacterium]|nr:response regulator receiver protein : Response regulator receiver protein OS=Frankia sp. (strain CcI3) GN=Francci3_3461 PE=4 SV=1: Response_reg [Gemmataceae bacterium]VTT98023.1 response regulator receiver protein : Response regulator receiver protein OS=Frankia sp. (strain CcI3) GN=Francci3_3461 PE=4 SV=1: Response_reg [Gemmataceae bacterium]
MSPANPERASPATVLVVDDEAAVRDFIRLALVHSGFSVRVAVDARDALRTFLDHPGEFALVVTDIRMPGRSGTELADDIRAAAPGVPVVFMSGYSGGTSRQPITLPPGAVVLDKPFSVEKLVTTVRQFVR